MQPNAESTEIAISLKLQACLVFKSRYMHAKDGQLNSHNPCYVNGDVSMSVEMWHEIFNEKKQ